MAVNIIGEDDIRCKTREGNNVCIHYQTNGKIHQMTVFSTVYGMTRDGFINRVKAQLEQFYEEQKKEYPNQSVQ